MSKSREEKKPKREKRKNAEAQKCRSSEVQKRRRAEKNNRATEQKNPIQQRGNGAKYHVEEFTTDRDAVFGDDGVKYSACRRVAAEYRSLNGID
jgi:hypothetical protein